jgi:hypothetical protein
MTRRERAQVVELLRCAADGDRPNGIFPAMENIGAKYMPIGADAVDSVSGINWGGYSDDEQYRAELLEAALRVEQGEWP